MKILLCGGSALFPKINRGAMFTTTHTDKNMKEKGRKKAGMAARPNAMELAFVRSGLDSGSNRSESTEEFKEE
jgi:hypothetical protein